MQSEEEEESDEEETRMAPPEDSGPSEAELAMQRRRAQQSHAGLDEQAQELLEDNRKMRDMLETEIQELRERSERRKKEREEEEKALAAKRAEEEAKRKAEEEERRKKKEEEEHKRKEDRAKKMAEFEKWKNPPKPNFVISKKADGTVGGGDEGDDDSKDSDRKSREQLEAERRAILQQRIQPLSIDGFDQSKLADKAKELHKDIYRLEAEKYDLEKRFKEQQYDMMELAERARQMNKVGKGGLKRVQLGQDEVDKIQERFAGAPAKIEMYSKYERQKDKRNYGERQNIFVGPMYGYPAARITPCKKFGWNENGVPEYEDLPGFKDGEPVGAGGGGEEGGEE